MAVLIDNAGRPLGVHSRHLIGRSHRMHTVFDNPEVSGQHAVVAWTGSSWTVRDLGSRNGTFVGGERIAAGADVHLAVGDVIGIGSTHDTLVLASDEAPGPFAWSGDAVVLGEGVILALPSLDDPVALVDFDTERGWLVETAGAATPVADGDAVEVSGAMWRLALPEFIAPTIEARQRGVSLDDVGLDFGVSADEEYVEVSVRLPDGPVRLTPRAHHYPLLVLARAWLDDTAFEGSSPDRGWLYAADLQKMLRMSTNSINLSIHRARRELDELGVEDSNGLVQRRRTTQQVRVGVFDLTVSRL